ERAISRLGRRVLARAGDVTDEAFLDDYYAAVGQTFARLDIVVNVAGGVKRGAFMDASRESIAADIQRNYGYVLQSVQCAVPLIRKGAAGGSIVNFTTIEAHRGAATFAVYAGAKAATSNFSRAAPDTTPSQGNFNAMSDASRESMAAVAAEHQGAGLA